MEILNPRETEAIVRTQYKEASRYCRALMGNMMMLLLLIIIYFLLKQFFDYESIVRQIS